MSNAEYRLELLEIKLMDLEQSVADLNEVIIRQYQLIDRLQSEQNRINSQLDELATGDMEAGSEVPPPHY